MTRGPAGLALALWRRDAAAPERVALPPAWFEPRVTACGAATAREAPELFVARAGAGVLRVQLRFQGPAPADALWGLRAV